MRRDAHAPLNRPFPRLSLAVLLGLARALAALPLCAFASPGSYSVSGIVINSETGDPAARVLVSLFDRDMHTVAAVASDAAGHFSFEGLAAGKYPLSASKRGFRTAFYDDHDGFNTAIVTGPDQDTEHLVFRLTPGAILSGVVTGDEGDPVEGARVMLFAKVQHPGGSAKILESETQITDDTGAYEFAELAGGDYLIAVSAEPWYATHPLSTPSHSPDAGPSPLDVAYPTTYFDSTSEEDAAATISLAAGSREVANMHLHAVPALHITVPADPGAQERRSQPTLQQIVFGVTMPAANVGYTRSEKSGSEFDGVAPGHYELRAGDPPHLVDLEATESRAVDPNEGSAMVQVSGSLRMADGSKPAEQMQLYLQQVGNPARPGQATEVHGGRFTFAAVPPGQWLAAGLVVGRSLPAVGTEIAGSAHAGGLFAVGDRPLVLTLILGSGAPSRIDGFARKGGKGIAGALIELIPRDGGSLETLGRRDQSDSDGSFSLPNVIPGRYTVVAIEGGWDLDWSDPRTMARYLPRGLSVTVTDAPGTPVRLNQPVPVQPR